MLPSQSSVGHEVSPDRSTLMEPHNLKVGETSSAPGLFKSMKAKFGMTSGKSKSHDNMTSTSMSAKGSSGYGDLGNATIPSQQGVAEKNRNPEIREHVSHHFHVQQSRQTMHQDYKGALCSKVTRRYTSWGLQLDGLDLVS